MITYKTGSLFNSETKGKYLAHACNTQGVWGGGIAVEFRERFPKDAQEYTEYDEDCSAIGTTLITSNKVVCLHTSDDMSRSTDPVTRILANTLISLDHFAKQIKGARVEVHSPRFNAGLFGVPWERTEAILKLFLAMNPNITWTVWTPESRF